jgi:hypothetical protein
LVIIAVPAISARGEGKLTAARTDSNYLPFEM